MNESKPRQMFPESRGVLFIFSPILGAFLVGFAYFVHLWQPITLGDKIAKILLFEVLFSFITLCIIGFVASIVGPHRLRPLILLHGGRAALAGLALIIGFVLVVLYYGFTNS